MLPLTNTMDCNPDSKSDGIEAMIVIGIIVIMSVIGCSICNTKVILPEKYTSSEILSDNFHIEKEISYEINDIEELKAHGVTGDIITFEHIDSLHVIQVTDRKGIVRSFNDSTVRVKRMGLKDGHYDYYVYDKDFIYTMILYQEKKQAYFFSNIQIEKSLWKAKI